MNRPPRRGQSPSFGYDPRVAIGPIRDGRPSLNGPLAPPPLAPPQHMQDYDEPPYHHQQQLSSNLYEFNNQQQSGFIEPSETALMHPHQQQSHPHQYSVGYRDHHRLPSTYRATLREQPFPNQTLHPQSSPMNNSNLLSNSSTSSAPYKILCITNLNQKIGDNPIREALINEFTRFGDISVSVCHDNGDRLAYIYFRSYEEAREARHSKLRSILFDKPIEIEPIYDPRASSPVELPSQFGGPNISNHQQQQFIRGRRSVTPPEYFNGPSLPPQARRPPLPYIQNQSHVNPHANQHNHHRANHHLARYPPNYIPGGPPTPYDNRYHLKGSHPPHLKAPLYGAQTHDQHRSYPIQPPHLQQHQPPLPHHHHQNNHQQPYGHTYGPTQTHSHGLQRDRERMITDAQLAARSTRQEPPYPIDRQRVPLGYQPTSLKDSRRLPPHIGSIHHHSRRSPSYLDHHLPNRFLANREKYTPDGFNNNEPEEGRPSRVLFITNIDQSKTENEIKEIFDRFGLIEEIELRKITGTDILSILIRFSSMDCAYKAKTATNGKYLANSTKPCRIAYGKVSATKRLWIGGLGVSTTVAILQDEFKKYGDIINVDYISGRPYAYVEYESANQAQFAMHHLKGTMSAEAERKLRIEYVESIADKTSENNNNSNNNKSIKNDISQDASTRSHSTNESWATSEVVEQNTPASPQYSNDNNNLKRSLSPDEDIETKRFHSQSEEQLDDNNTTESPPPTPPLPPLPSDDTPNYNDDYNVDKNPSNNSKEIDVSNEQSTELLEKEFSDKNNCQVGEEGEENKKYTEEESILRCTSIRNLVDCCPISWTGQLVLRNFNFPSKMYLCSGNELIVDKYIVKLNGTNSDTCPILKITQRWRLHPQPKLEEVRKKMQTANLGMLIFTSMPFNDSSPLSSSSPASCMKTPQTPGGGGVATKQNGAFDNKEVKESDLDKTSASINSDSPTTTQSRPLKNLISYLEQKDAAGVISLNALDRDQSKGSKLLYAFPPGDFAMNLLKLKAPNLLAEAVKEEFLLGVIVGCTDNKI